MQQSRLKRAFTRAVGAIGVVAATSLVGAAGIVPSVSAGAGSALPPGAPTGVSAVALPAAGQLRIDFTAPTDAGSTPITLYIVRCIAQSDERFFDGEAEGTESPIIVIGLVLEMNYQCGVTAYNEAGAGPESEMSATVLVPDAPGFPDTPTAARTNIGRQLKVRIVRPHDGGSVITSYRVVCSTMAVGGRDLTMSYKVPKGTNPAVVTVVFTGMTPGSVFRCYAAASNMIGEGPESFLGNAVKIPNVPGKPTASAVFKSSTVGRVLVRIVPPSSNGGAVVTSYVVTCSATGGATRTATVAAPAAGIARFDVAVTGLTRGVWYRCAVVARNISGSSAPGVSPAFRL